MIRKLILSFVALAGLCSAASADPQFQGTALSALQARVTAAQATANGAVQPNTVAALLGSKTSGSLPALDMSWAATVNPNAVAYLPGNRLSFCPALSCIIGPSNGTQNSAFYDHQRASLLVSGATQDDMHSEEQTLAVTTTIGTGYLKPYAASSSYSLGDNVAVGSAVYRATAAGTTGANSAPPGARPTSAPYSVQDGTVTWLWINDSAIAAKVGIYNETQKVAGGGNGWAQANNFQVMSGANPSYDTNTEFDFTNNSGIDYAIGAANGNNLVVSSSGGNSSTTAIQVTSGNATSGKAGVIWGIRTNGHLASQAAIELDDDAPVGVSCLGSGIGSSHSASCIQDSSSSPRTLYSTGSHTIATIDDPSSSPAAINSSGSKSIADVVLGSTAPRAIQINGTKSSSQIEANGSSPATLATGGTRSLADVFLNATAPNGLSLNGTYSGAQITGKNFAVDPAGNTAVASIKLAASTVANLPACNSGTQDRMVVVTDATSPTYRGALTGGGTIRTPVYCDGSSWTAH